MTNAIFRFLSFIRNRQIELRGFMLTLYLRMLGCKVGKGLRCTGWPFFKVLPCGNIEIGNHVTIGKNVTLEVQQSGRLLLDDYSKLTQNVIVSVCSSVRIGKHSGVAEYCSIRDSEHGAKKGQLLWQQPLISDPIIIGDDVQISRGCSIFRGTTVERGVIIGANCILTRNCRTVENGIYLGTPPKLIGKRI